MSTQINYRFKILIVGDSSVGKSSIMRLYIHNIFDKSIQTTIGFDFLSKFIKIDEDNIKLEIWDTPGTESYRSIVKAYYRNSSIIIYTYDITNEKSFNNIKYWLDESLKILNPESFNRILLGSKKDLLFLKKVDFEKAEKFANENDMYFIECSCLIHDSVNETINNIVKDTIEKIINGKIILDTGSIRYNSIDSINLINNKNICC